MSKFLAIAITAAICLPLGGLTQRKASADQRTNNLEKVGVLAIDGHPHLTKAQLAVHIAAEEISGRCLSRC